MNVLPGLKLKKTKLVDNFKMGEVELLVISLATCLLLFVGRSGCGVTELPAYNQDGRADAI